MHYMNWARVMFPAVVEESEMVYIFFASSFFSLSLLIGKRSTLAKIWDLQQYFIEEFPYLLLPFVNDILNVHLIICSVNLGLLC